MLAFDHRRSLLLRGPKGSSFGRIWWITSCKGWQELCPALPDLFLFLSSLTSKGSHAPYDPEKIVDFVNKNRTATKLPKLYNSPGLGCMALQFLLECTQNCTSNNTLACQPAEIDITEVYAPNCGVELPTVNTISGHLVGCYWSHLNPEQAFSTVLVPTKTSLSVLHSKEHHEVGVGYVREHHGPFLWCILFSDGNATSSTFALEGGTGIKQRRGCFSGGDVPCNAGTSLLPAHNTLLSSICCLLVQLVLVFG
ncbi:hypothetical protein GW17_00036174 [Ensete ventricosum]|nr:hypothetical protein GW17_00036174 [Ensete ventricosum]